MATKPKIERVLPPYEQVATDLRDRIEKGEYAPGDLIPSERELADEWGISRATATKAVAALRSQGLVESVTGVGTKVVLQPSPITWSPHERYTIMYRQTGLFRDPREYTTSVKVEVAPAPDEVRIALDLKPGAKVIARYRQMSTNGTPTELSTSWFDAAFRDDCPRLLEKDRIAEGTTAYVATELGVEPTHGQDLVSAELATDQDIHDLGIDAENGPRFIMVTRTTIFDEHNHPITYEVYKQPHSHQALYEYQLTDE